MSTVSKVTCPECFTVLKPARPLAVGQKVKCPKCENLFTAEAEGPEGVRATTAPAPAKKAAPAKAAPAKPEAKKKADDDEEEGGGTYGVVREKSAEEEEDDKPKISYAPDMSIKDLRGPAVAALMQPSNYLLRAGIAGFLGWLTVIVMCAIPVLFPLSDDQRPIKPIGPGLAAGAPAGGVPIMGGGASEPGGGKKEEEERGSFLQLGPYDLTDIAQVGGRFMILLAFTPFFAGMVFSGILTFGAVKAQNLESRGWGIASCIMAMFPINIIGLGMASGVVIWLALELVFDAGWFRGFLLVMWMNTLWLMSLGSGVWCLIALLSEDVIAGFEYEPE